MFCCYYARAAMARGQACMI